MGLRWRGSDEDSVWLDFEVDVADRWPPGVGDGEVEVCLARLAGESDREAEARAGALVPRLELVVRRLAEIVSEAVALAPADWRQAGERPAGERVSFDGIDVRDGVVHVVLYDDELVYVELVAALDHDNRVRSVVERQI